MSETTKAPEYAAIKARHPHAEACVSGDTSGGICDCGALEARRSELEQAAALADQAHTAAAEEAVGTVCVKCGAVLPVFGLVCKACFDTSLAVVEIDRLRAEVERLTRELDDRAAVRGAVDALAAAMPQPTDAELITLAIGLVWSTGVRTGDAGWKRAAELLRATAADVERLRRERDEAAVCMGCGRINPQWTSRQDPSGEWEAACFDCGGEARDLAEGVRLLAQLASRTDESNINAQAAECRREEAEAALAAEKQRADAAEEKLALTEAARVEMRTVAIHRGDERDAAEAKVAGLAAVLKEANAAAVGKTRNLALALRIDAAPTDAAPILAAVIEAAVAPVRAERDALVKQVTRLIAERDALVNTLVHLFGWSDTTYLHALMHVENAVLNQRTDLSVAQKERDALAAAVTKARACLDNAEGPRGVPPEIWTPLSRAEFHLDAALAGSKAALDAREREVFTRGWLAGRDAAAALADERAAEHKRALDAANNVADEDAAAYAADEAEACEHAIRALTPPEEVSRG